MWYVIQVLTGSEVAIAEKLNRQGVRALVPRENRLIRSGGEWKQKEYILFPGYVFLEMVYNAGNYYKVRGLPGVIRFLGDGGPSRLSYLEAEWIMLLSGKENRPIEPTVVRQEADGSMKVVSGVLEKLAPRVIRYDRRGRKATFEITICNEKREVRLSIRLDGESLNVGAGEKPPEGFSPGRTEENPMDAGTDEKNAAGDAAERALQEADLTADG